MLSPDYVRLVLSENFADAKTLFLSPLMAAHSAHLVMLAELGLISRLDAAALRDALDRIDVEAVAAAPYTGDVEDLFFYVDRQLARLCGEDTAGRLHIARSRNDLDMTMYRMRLREWLLGLTDEVLTLRRTLLAVARDHVATLFAAHTHTQPAQPTSLAHYLLGIVEQLERDATRLLGAYGRTNRSPLGACAITGTGFRIDRRRTSELLGFDAPTGNTYGSIAAVDHLLESVSALAVTVIGLGRVVQDLLLWCTVEVGYLRLPDGLVQRSSVMPQKRNPVALEHARALASKAAGEAAAVLTATHNIPFGDVVDTEDDVQPLVAAAFKDASRAVALVAVALAGAQFDVPRMRAGAGRNGVTLTELADTLAREHDVPFTHAHRIAAALASVPADNAEAMAAALAQKARDVLGRDIAIEPALLQRVLSPEHFIAVRRTEGGPAPERVQVALSDSLGVLAADEATVSRLRGALSAAQAALTLAHRAL
jgi:argininosuccinate lyase